MKKRIKKGLSIFAGILTLTVLVLYLGVQQLKSKFLTDSPNYLTIKENNGAFDFVWSASNFNGIEEPHGAILFPVQLPNVDGTFYMQWDTGAANTLFYAPAISSLYNQFEGIDTIYHKKTPFLKNFSFTVGKSVEVEMQYSRLMEYGSAVDFTKDEKPIIGTIGSDFIDGQVFTMNFLSQTVAITSENTLNESLLSNFTFDGRRILLPAEINNDKAVLYYDSGSSPFGLLTSKNQFEELGAINAKTVSYEVNSWGEKLLCFNKESRTKIKFDETSLELQRISYIDFNNWTTNLQGFALSFSNVKGILGNKSLINSTLILDVKNEKFAIVDGTSSIAINSRH